MTYEEYRNLVLGGSGKSKPAAIIDSNVPWEVTKGLVRGVQGGLIGGTIRGVGLAMGQQETTDPIADFFQQQANTGWEAPTPGIQGDFWEHPFLRTASGFGESLPSSIAAAVVTVASKNPILGAFVLAPQVFGQTLKEAKDRGLDDTTAYFTAAGNAALATATEAYMPLTSLLKGGALGMRVMRQGLQEGGEEVIQGMGQEALLRAAGARPKPLNDVINDLAEQASIGFASGGAVGGIFPAGFEELTEKEKKRSYATRFFDNIIAPVLQNEGRPQSEIDSIRNSEIEKVAVKIEGAMGTGRLSTPERLKEALNLLSQDMQMVPFVGSFHVRNGKNVSTIPNNLSEATYEIKSKANDILLKGTEEAGKHNVVDMPNIVRHAMRNEIVEMLTKGTAEVPTPWTDVGVIEAIRDHKLKAQDPKNLYLMGTKNNEVAANTKVFNPVNGVLELADVAKFSTRNGFAPDNLNLIHSRGDVGLAKQTYDLLVMDHLVHQKRLDNEKKYILQKDNLTKEQQEKVDKISREGDPIPTPQEIETKQPVDESVVPTGTNEQEVARVLRELDKGEEIVFGERRNPVSQEEAVGTVGDRMLNEMFAGNTDQDLSATLTAIARRGGNQVETPKALVSFEEMIKSVFGKTIVWTRGVKQFAGFTVSGQSKYVVVDLDGMAGFGTKEENNGEVPHHNLAVTAFHEIFHALEEQDPDVVSRVFDGLQLNRKNAEDNLFLKLGISQENVDKLSAVERRDLLLTIFGVTPDRLTPGTTSEQIQKFIDRRVVKEALADAFGNTMVNPDMLHQLALNDPLSFRALYRAITKFINRIKAFFTQDIIRERSLRGMDDGHVYGAFAQSMEEVQQRMAQVAHEFAAINRQRVDMPEINWYAVDDQEIDANGDIQDSGGVSGFRISITPDTNDATKPMSAGMNGPINTRELPTSARTMPMKVALSVSTRLGWGDFFNRFMKKFMGERAYMEEFKQVPTADVVDQILQGLTSDKMLEAYVQAMAADNLYPMAVLVEKEALRLTSGNKAASQRLVKLFKNILARANEEIIVFGNEPGKFSMSYTGMGGAWLPSDQADPNRPGKEWSNRDNFVRNMEGILKELQSLGHPAADDLEQAMPTIKNERPELAYFKLLAKLGAPELQKMLIWSKQELENPALKAMMEAGVLKSADIYTNIFNGFSHRMFDKKGLQRIKGSPQQSGADDSTGSTASISSAETESYDDFYGKTLEAGLDPSNDYLENMRQYLRNTYLKAQQYRTLSWLKGFRLADTENLRLPGFENDANVNHLIAQAHYVEYADSPIINALVKATKLSPMDILEKLGYINDKRREGLVEWRGFSYRPPFLQASLSDVLNRLYPEKNELVTRLSKYINIPKRIITLNPFDGTLMFASGVLANAGWRAPLVLGKFLMHGVRAGGAFVNSSLALMKGEGYDVRADTTHMEDLPLLLRHGFAAGWNGIASSVFEDIKLDRALTVAGKTPAQALDEWIETVGFSNKVMFEQFLFQELYNVAKNRLDEFRKMTDANGNRLMTEDQAAQRVASLMNTISNLTPSHLLGKEGPIYNLGLFSRGLAIAPIRAVLATNPGRALVKRFEGVQRYNTGTQGMLNPFTSADISQADADFLARYYSVHIVKMVGISLLAKGIIQYALSFLDDDKKDEFGQKGHDPFNKKRNILNNPNGNKFSVRLPWKGVRGEQLTMTSPVFPEPKRMADMFGLGKLPFPVSTINYINNRLNAWIPQVLGFITNHDIRTGQKISDFTYESIYDHFYKAFLKPLVPLSFAQTEQEKGLLTQENQFLEAGLTTAQIMGGGIGSYPSFWWNYGGEDRTEFIAKGAAAKDIATRKASEMLKKMKTSDLQKARQQGATQEQINRERQLRMTGSQRERINLRKKFFSNERANDLSTMTMER